MGGVRASPLSSADAAGKQLHSAQRAQSRARRATSSCFIDIDLRECLTAWVTRNLGRTRSCGVELYVDLLPSDEVRFVAYAGVPARAVLDLLDLL